jgi:hypothetical protein
MDLVKRAGQLKPMLVDFALSPLFNRELKATIAEHFPGMIVDDEAMFSMVLDHFALQHRLPSGTTVVAAFVAAHPELTEADRKMLLGWQDVVEGMFEVTGKDRDAAPERAVTPLRRQAAGSGVRGGQCAAARAASARRSSGAKFACSWDKDARFCPMSACW